MFLIMYECLKNNKKILIHITLISMKIIYN